MDAAITPVLNLLARLDAIGTEGRRRAVACLQPAPPEPIARLLVDERNTLAGKPIRAAMALAATVAGEHVLGRSITDWPFENFWDKLPYEPRHSKLLGYFIDTLGDHGCGAFLLAQLFAAIAQGEDLPVEGCRVMRPESHRIDLHIVRHSGDEQRDFSVLIENKINDAPYQPRQLSRYVAIVNREYPNIRPDRIFAFYLSRTDEPSVDPLVHEDQRLVQEFSTPNWPGLHPVWAQISFRTHIQTWIARSIEQWPPKLPRELCESLTHYRNLIRYLIHKHMNLDLQTKLLAQLERVGDAELPAWTDVITVKQSAEELQPALESVLRGKLLLEVFRRLPPAGTWIGYDGDHSRLVNSRSPFAPCFLENINVCLRVHPNVAVGFGTGPSTGENGAWLGYVRLGEPTGQQAIEQIVFEEASARGAELEDEGWYRFRVWRPDYGSRLEDLVPTVVGWLCEMRDSLAARLAT